MCPAENDYEAVSAQALGAWHLLLIQEAICKWVKTFGARMRAPLLLFVACS